jgi:SAM-dependent methyltransferase
MLKDRALVHVRALRQSYDRWRLLRRLPQGGTCAEVGVWKGENAAAILRTNKPRTLYLIDPWEHQPEYTKAMYGGRAAGQQEMDAIHTAVERRFAREVSDSRVHVWRMRSSDAPEKLHDVRLDWAWIDGDHTYEAVKADLESFARVLAPGGYLAGDDYMLGWWGNDVIRAVDEFAAAHRCQLDIIGSQHFLIKLNG